MFFRSIKLFGDGSYDQEIVGESHYQRQLERVAGGKQEDSAEHYCEALLLPDSNNPHDKNAVAVKISGKTVGYLSRRDAIEYREELKDIRARGRKAKCDAVIVGGWRRADGDEGSFGVRLDVVRPLERE